MRLKIAAAGLALIFLFTPVLLQGKQIVIGAADFIPSANEAYYQDGAQFYKKNTASLFAFYAPVHLPQGAKVKSVTLYYLDNHSGGEVQFSLRRQDPSIHWSWTMCYYFTQGYSNSVRSQTITTISDNKIDNRKYSYYIQVYFSQPESLLRFFGVKIKYTGGN